MIFSSKIIADGDCSHEIKRRLLLGRKAVTNLDSILKSRDITADKVRIVKAMDFSSSHVWTWKLDHKEGWVPKNWCFQTVVLEKTLESPLDCKEIKQSMLKEINSELSWLEFNGIEFTGRTDAEAPVPWPPDVNSWLIGKDPDSGKDWGQQKGAAEDEHHQLNAH